MTVHVALLRGINVGGNNLIKMADLKRCFEDAGFTDVHTIIASGNVVFRASQTTQALTKLIEAALDETFGGTSPARVVVLTAAELAAVVAEAPPKFGKEPAKYRYDVLFVKPPLIARDALPEVPLKEGVDEAYAGAHALYFRRLTAKATQSRLSRIMGLPLYQSVTIRNWNTTTKLLAKVQEPAPTPAKAPARARPRQASRRKPAR